ncbi:LamG domain-containing protein [Thermococcus kodakarensis]|uniref:LamG domain-containing protein n=1 Tax=Thermococcus kodakarensis TaxID=311400 RepID=UPI0013053020|nr:LamG domain-containing protein [Thermococcus kodakarensis]WCN28188.1 LamG domain-containing protein [Thermococcus kodakarensis]WCN30485.1 LamG domain-containing protein [Thermococcus kodakarensis]
MRFRKALGVLVVALFLAALAGTASAAETHVPKIDLPKWVIVPEDSSFSDVTLFCGLDAYDASTNTTPCYYSGTLTNATIVFNTTTGYPKLVTGKIGNAFEFKTGAGVSGSATLSSQQITIALWFKVIDDSDRNYIRLFDIGDLAIVWRSSDNKIYAQWISESGEGKAFISQSSLELGKWYFATFVLSFDTGESYIYIDADVDASTSITGGYTLTSSTFKIHPDTNGGDVIVDEVRVYDGKALSQDEVNLLYLAGRKKLSEPASFRQIFSPLIDLTRDRATFYAGLEVSTTDPSGYVPVPESAVNMSITSAEKLKSDYTNADFYYQGHYWYRADKIQFNLPIQFETIRTNGDFDDVIILDEDQKTYVYEREFKVTNPTGAKLNIVYSLDPTALGFSVLQYPQFELDGVRMVSWRPDENSSQLYLIRTDTLEPGEISTHWIRSIWTLSKEELNFPAKLEDFRNILDWQTAQKMAENAVKGKADTWVKVIKVSSNADVSNVTIYVPLKDVEDTNDVIEAVALTGSRETLQVEELEDGTIAVKVPADAFVSGEAEIKVFYNKETSWWKSILDRIMGMVKMIKSFFGFGGG